MSSRIAKIMASIPPGYESFQPLGHDRVVLVGPTVPPLEMNIYTGEKKPLPKDWPVPSFDIWGRPPKGSA